MKEIQLTQGKMAIVDDEDYEWLNQWKWHFDNKGYPSRNSKLNGSKATIVTMHREILRMKRKDGLYVDHINENKCDNRKENLRICSNSENVKNQTINASNTSGFKGVSWHKDRKKWRSQIRVNKKIKHIGYFETIEIAHFEYCKAALKYHGEFANFGNGCVILEKNND